MTPIKYESANIPKTMRALLERHADKVKAVDFGGGFCTDSGNAYDVVLRPGWVVKDDGTHGIIEPTISDVRDKLSMVIRCACKGCLALRGKEQHQS